MPVNETKNNLRSVLENRSTEELEQLLAADFSEAEDAVPNVEYITTILEVIHEREKENPQQNAETEAAWQEFQAFIRAEEQNQSESTTGRSESPSLDHLCNSESGEAPQTYNSTKTRRKSYTRVLRICAVAAALIILFCGSAYAAGWNIFQALAQWTEETFSFLMRSDHEVAPVEDMYKDLRLAIEKRSDVPSVPNWIPKGMEQVGEVKVAEGSRSVKIAGVYGDGEREFTVRVTVYHTVPEEFTTTYQKDDATVQVYEVLGVSHYIMENYENVSATWTNGCIEGHIQGGVTVEEMQKMIDSIYEG